MDVMELMVRSFLKIIGLDYLDLFDIEADFENIEAGDDHVGYLDTWERAVYLIFLFCEEKVDFYQLQAERAGVAHNYSEMIDYWLEKANLCDSLLTHALRVRFELPCNLGLKIVEDYLVVSYLFEYEEDLENTCLN